MVLAAGTRWRTPEQRETEYRSALPFISKKLKAFSYVSTAQFDAVLGGAQGDTTTLWMGPRCTRNCAPARRLDSPEPDLNGMQGGENLDEIQQRKEPGDDEAK